MIAVSHTTLGTHQEDTVRVATGPMGNGYWAADEIRRFQVSPMRACATGAGPGEAQDRIHHLAPGVGRRDADPRIMGAKSDYDKPLPTAPNECASPRRRA